MLQQRYYATHMFIFIGSVFKEEDLLRARVMEAQAAFILPSRYPEDKHKVHIFHQHVLKCVFSSNYIDLRSI